MWRRRGSEEGEAGRRVQEVRTQTPRSGFTDGRTDGRFVENQAPECGVRFHAQISSSTVGPRKSPRNVEVSRVVGKRARRFRQNVFFVRVCVIGWLVASPANGLAGQTDNRFFLIVLLVLFIFCILVRRATSFSFLNLSFFWETR
jgi:hypothetical protein